MHFFPGGQDVHELAPNPENVPLGQRVHMLEFHIAYDPPAHIDATLPLQEYPGGQREQDVALQLE